MLKLQPPPPPGRVQPLAVETPLDRLYDFGAVGGLQGASCPQVATRIAAAVPPELWTPHPFIGARHTADLGGFLALRLITLSAAGVELFTPPRKPHRHCTDFIAEASPPLVIVYTQIEPTSFPYLWRPTRYH